MKKETVLYQAAFDFCVATALFAESHDYVMKSSLRPLECNWKSVTLLAGQTKTTPNERSRHNLFPLYK